MRADLIRRSTKRAWAGILFPEESDNFSPHDVFDVAEYLIMHDLTMRPTPLPPFVIWAMQCLPDGEARGRIADFYRRHAPVMARRAALAAALAALATFASLDASAQRRIATETVDGMAFVHDPTTLPTAAPGVGESDPVEPEPLAVARKAALDTAASILAAIDPETHVTTSIMARDAPPGLAQAIPTRPWRTESGGQSLCFDAVQADPAPGTDKAPASSLAPSGPLTGGSAPPAPAAANIPDHAAPPVPDVPDVPDMPSITAMVEAPSTLEYTP